LGHISYLSSAADLGDVLIVGLNSDDSVRQLKGNHRPINNEKSRAMLLASLHFVSAVTIFTEQTPINLIKIVQPDVLVKGGDYRPEEIVGYEIVKAKGGRIIALDLVPGYSTTTIEEKVKEFSGLKKG
jgi:rfaE bifunctional protein nucleotidyltransferase chain/domain